MYICILYILYMNVYYIEYIIYIIYSDAKSIYVSCINHSLLRYSPWKIKLEFTAAYSLVSLEQMKSKIIYIIFIIYVNTYNAYNDIYIYIYNDIYIYIYINRINKTTIIYTILSFIFPLLYIIKSVIW